MAEGLNRAMLFGNLGADPDLRFTQGGQAVLNMRLATTESYLDKNRVRQERTDWHNVVVWGKRGEALAKILTKGFPIFVEGSIRTSSYNDRDGNKRYKTGIVANKVLFGRRGGGASDEGAGEGHDESSGGGGGYRGGDGRPGGAGAGSGVTGNRDPSGRGTAAPAKPPGQEDYYEGDYGGGTDDDIPF